MDGGGRRSWQLRKRTIYGWKIANIKNIILTEKAGPFDHAFDILQAVAQTKIPLSAHYNVFW